MSKYKHARDVVSIIKPGQRVFIHGGSATPNILLNALIEQASNLKDVELIHLHTICDIDYANKKYENSFRIANLFIGSNLRPYVNLERVDYLPCFLSEVPKLFRSKVRPINVAMLHLSLPNRHGYCTLGTSVDVAKAAFEVADRVIAQINVRMPYVHGDGFIHIDDIDAYVEVDAPLPEPKMPELSAKELAIGKFVGEIIEDGACLQVGIGAIPDAVLGTLKGHKHLGIHSEMWSDGVLDLIKSGSIDNSLKSVHPGTTVSSFIIGSQEVYDFVDDNPSVIQLGIDYINNPSVIARNAKVTAINTAIEIDLSGQICADSIGHRVISGVGGQLDFMRGASLSSGGKPIIAINSRTAHGKSKIVPALKVGAGVVSTRGDVHFVVTEYGVTNLFGKTLSERAKSLIEIAHPDDQEWLSRSWQKIRSRFI